MQEKLLWIGLAALPLLAASLYAPPVFGADVNALVVSGDTRAVDAQGRERRLNRGDELRAGERLETGADGRAQLRFADGAMVSVQPNTSFRVDEFRFSGKEDGKESVSMSLLRGAFRTVTGVIGRTNKNAYRLQTPTATIGIRGTEYLAQLVGQALTVTVGEGSIAIANNLGTVVINTGQTGFVRAPNAAPQIISVAPTLGPAPATRVAQTDEAKKSEERSSTGAPTSVQDNDNGQIRTLYTTAVTTGIATTAHVATSTGGTSGSVSAPLGTGPYAIAYAAGPNVGIDSRQNVAATFAANGALAGYESGTSEKPTIGTNTTSNVSGDQFITVGRWTGGTTAGQFFTSGPFTFNSNQGFHYALGVRSPTLPSTGTATYAMLGATSPTTRDGTKTPGSALGELAVNWGGTSTKVGLHLKVTMPGDAVYEVLTNGGTANPSSSEISFFNGLFFGSSLTTAVTSVGGSGYSCSGSCNTDVRGFFAGTGQERAGVSYALGGNGVSGKIVDGAMSFSPATITPMSALPGAGGGGGGGGGGVGPLGSAPDRILTITAGAIGGAGPGSFSSAAFNTSNGLTSFTTNTGTSTLGSASIAEAGGDSFIAWGRWTNGVPVNVSMSGTSIPLNGGFHYLLGVPATNLPTAGTGSYSLLGATAPTISDGSLAPGTYTGSLFVSFSGATTKIGMNSIVNIGGDTYTFTTNGGLGAPTSSQITVQSSGTAAQKTQWTGTSSVLISIPVSGPTACVSCTASVQGSFIGANAERAGMTYSIGGLSGGKNIQGAAAFTKVP